MDFNDPKTNSIIRVIALIASTALTIYLLITDGFIIATTILIVLIGLQAVSLIRNLNKSSDEINPFLDAFELQGVRQHYSVTTDSAQLNRLNKLINATIKNIKDVRHEREDDFQYLKNIVQHIGMGLLTFDSKGKVQIINTSAKRLLKVDHLDYIDELRETNAHLVDILKRLRTGGRDLLRLERNGDILQLAIYAIELTLRGEVYKLISIQNIQNELEEKEMEAWQNLIRVLTHEIMNSVTPISSLANTVEEELNQHIKNGQESAELKKEDLEDIYLAVSTIEKRSDGLIKFVQDFRNLTHIPVPKLTTIQVKSLFDEILLLLKNEIESNDIQLVVSVEPGELSIKADKSMIEQVLINLIKNATQAFEDQKNRLIELKAYKDDKRRPTITVLDNGSGIEEEALEKIFIPFFTTKKSGSGIGLSLSRQIMRKHQGTLSVTSTLDEGTQFFLRF